MVFKRNCHLTAAKTKPERKRDVVLPSKTIKSESKRAKAHGRGPTDHTYTIASIREDVPARKVDSSDIATSARDRSPLPKHLKTLRDREHPLNRTNDTTTVVHGNTILREFELQAHQPSSPSRQCRSKIGLGQELAPASLTAATYSSDRRDIRRSVTRQHRDSTTQNRTIRMVGSQGKELDNGAPTHRLASPFRQPKVNISEWQNLVFGESGDATEKVVPGGYRNNSQLAVADTLDIEEMEAGLVERQMARESVTGSPR
jgi:hypothetical protein